MELHQIVIRIKKLMVLIEDFENLIPNNRHNGIKKIENALCELYSYLVAKQSTLWDITKKDGYMTFEVYNPQDSDKTINTLYFNDWMALNIALGTNYAICMNEYPIFQFFDFRTVTHILINQFSGICEKMNKQQNKVTYIE